METQKITGKQLLIQLAINIVASAIVSYIMYKLLAPKDETPPAAAASKTVSQTPPVTTTPATQGV